MYYLLFTLQILFILNMDATTTIEAQVFCDNYCQIFYNGEEVLAKGSNRQVQTFSFEADQTGTRTFAVVLQDNPYTNSSNGLWNYSSESFFTGQTGCHGEVITHQYCLGDGAFRAIFTDDTCGEMVVTSDSWKCYRVRSGPVDIKTCFPKWETKHTSPTFGGEDDRYILYDPCIREVEPKAACSSTVYWYNPDWNTVGFDDSGSDWFAATEYTVYDAVPKAGRSATALLFECEDYQYCNTCLYPESSWGESSFIWSDEMEYDNEILCRYEYTVGSC